MRTSAAIAPVTGRISFDWSYSNVIRKDRNEIASLNAHAASGASRDPSKRTAELLMNSPEIAKSSSAAASKFGMTFVALARQSTERYGD